MGLKTVRKDASLHLAYATGILKFLKLVLPTLESGGTVSLGEAFKAVQSKDDDANFFIFEFMKDFGVIFTPEQLRGILDGNRSLLWRYVNKDLSRFGHPAVEPMEIALT